LTHLSRFVMPQDTATSIAQHTESTLAATIELRRHLRQHIGPTYKFTRPDTFGVHKVGVCIFPPDEHKPYWTVCTAGMSDISMERAPLSARNIELLISLPEEWNWADPVNSWPLALMRTMVELIASDPNKSIIYGQSVRAKRATIPIFSSTDRAAGGVLFGRPALLPERAWHIVSGELNVRWLAILPIFVEEIEFAEKHGEHILIDKLEEAKVSELFDRRRINTCSGVRG
jgi:hypothetical protein